MKEERRTVVVGGGTSTLNEVVGRVLIEKGQGAFYFDEIHYKTVGGEWKKPTQQNKPWYRQGSRW